MKHIVIMVHRNGSFEAHYLLWAMAELWREADIRVSVVRGPGQRIDADLAVLHVDLTVVPDDHLECIRQYPVVINGPVADISKRVVSRNLVLRSDGYQGPVVVKTDRNFGGKPEMFLARRGAIPRGQTRSIREMVKFDWNSPNRVAQYPIFESVAEVPQEIWDIPDLVVERFLPERREDKYCFRCWEFLGDAESNRLFYTDLPIVTSSVMRKEDVAEIPEELRRMRRELGFDYGKFDYGIVDGRVVLYDANRTPSLGTAPKEKYLPRVRGLAAGIRKFL